MKVWAADICNAYLEATTKEKLYIVAGPEFEELQGHILVIHKALYGSREMKDKYEYIAIYVDDLLIASEEPQKIIQDLKDKCMLKIKGDGPLEYHLGCDYKQDKDGTLVAQSTRYINKISESYKKMFPTEDFINAKSPLKRMTTQS